MTLGRLLASDARERTTLDATSTVADAAVRMKQPRVRALIVTDGDRPIGIVTRRDFLERVIAPGLALETPLPEVMSVDLVTAPAELMIEDAVELMNRHSIRHLAVVAPDGAPIGVIGLEVLAGWIAADRETRIDDVVYHITHG